MDFLTVEFASTILSKTAQADLTEKIIIIAVCFWYIKKTFKHHFDNVERGLTKVATSLTDLGNSLARIEMNHSQRIEALEKWRKNEIEKLKSIN